MDSTLWNSATAARRRLFKFTKTANGPVQIYRVLKYGSQALDYLRMNYQSLCRGFVCGKQPFFLRKLVMGVLLACWACNCFVFLIINKSLCFEIQFYVFHLAITLFQHSQNLGPVFDSGIESLII